MGVVVSGASSGLPLFLELPASAHRQLKSRSAQVFDESHHLMLDGHVAEGMDLLAQWLLAVRDAQDSQTWEQLCQDIIHHPVGQIVWQDPFTRHSFEKPRGYAGDAQLLDYLYGKLPPPDETTPLGRRVFDYMVQQLGARGVRSRGQIIAKIIDDVAFKCRSPRILSIACGHLREAELSTALSEGRIGEFLALDQDPQSLAHVQREFGDKGVQTVQSSVRAILAEKTGFENLNLVYAAGLYDYLSDRVAARLTRLMFDMLAPGGRLVIANFAPCLPEAGYMETFMAWKLIYRQPHELHQLAQDIAGDEWSSSRLFWDESESIIFLDLIKHPPKLKMTGVVKPRTRNGNLSMPIHQVRST